METLGKEKFASILKMSFKIKDRIGTIVSCVHISILRLFNFFFL